MHWQLIAKNLSIQAFKHDFGLMYLSYALFFFLWYYFWIFILQLQPETVVSLNWGGNIISDEGRWYPKFFFSPFIYTIVYCSGVVLSIKHLPFKYS